MRFDGDVAVEITGGCAFFARFTFSYDSHGLAFVDAGGLMSYGADGPALFRHGAKFVQRILQGRQPNDLPIEQPTKFELVFNLKTAHVLGLTVPPKLLFTADEVIE